MKIGTLVYGMIVIGKENKSELFRHCDIAKDVVVEGAEETTLLTDNVINEAGKLCLRALKAHEAEKKISLKDKIEEFKFYASVFNVNDERENLFQVSWEKSPLSWLSDDNRTSTEKRG